MIAQLRIGPIFPRFYRNRLLPGLVLAIAFTMGSNCERQSHSQESDSQGVPLIRGKTYDSWIAQAKGGRALEDRHNAFQVLRNDGLEYDRKRTLRVFTDALSDETPSIRSLAAAGLIKAGRPTDPKAAEELVKALSKHPASSKPPPIYGSKAYQSGKEVNFPAREIRALGAVGETHHIPTLTAISENAKVNQLLRQFADNAIQEIEKRDREARRKTKNGTRGSDDGN